MGRRRRQPETPKVEWADYDRVEPDDYVAYCRAASVYFDEPYQRWTCLLRFDLLAPNKVDVIARVPMWLSLGGGNKPHAPRRGRYWEEWLRASGGPPARGDRLSPRVFIRRVARVIVGDTNSATAPYTVVKAIVAWETGPSCQSVSSPTVKDGSKKASENQALPKGGCLESA
jgi:hypothetical protein